MCIDDKPDVKVTVKLLASIHQFSPNPSIKAIQLAADPLNAELSRDRLISL